MKYLVFPLAAIVAYLVSGINPAIVMAKLIYHEDIRQKGSGNPGFTNFKRVYGNKYAWYVFGLDIIKGVILCLGFAFVFKAALGGVIEDAFVLGAAFTGLCAMLGHAYPVWYGFKGGKAFLVAAAAIFVMDWRSGLIAMVIMLILLFTIKYMSLSVMVAAVTCPITIAIFGANWYIIVLCAVSAAFLIFRHKGNIVKLCKGTESKFHVSDKVKSK